MKNKPLVPPSGIQKRQQRRKLQRFLNGPEFAQLLKRCMSGFNPPGRRPAMNICTYYVVLRGSADGCGIHVYAPSASESLIEAQRIAEVPWPDIEYYPISSQFLSILEPGLRDYRNSSALLARKRGSLR